MRTLTSDHGRASTHAPALRASSQVDDAQLRFEDVMSRMHCTRARSGAPRSLAAVITYAKRAVNIKGASRALEGRGAGATPRAGQGASGSARAVACKVSRQGDAARRRAEEIASPRRRAPPVCGTRAATAARALARATPRSRRDARPLGKRNVAAALAARRVATPTGGGPRQRSDARLCPGPPASCIAGPRSRARARSDVRAIAPARAGEHGGPARAGWAKMRYSTPV